MNPQTLNLDTILQMLAAPTPTPAKKLQKLCLIAFVAAFCLLKVSAWFHLTLPADVVTACNEIQTPAAEAFFLAQLSVDQSATPKPVTDDTGTQQ